jgi:hypothetical protein
MRFVIDMSVVVYADNETEAEDIVAEELQGILDYEVRNVDRMGMIRVSSMRTGIHLC